jgi:thiol-disulfide isomerase/thioredoxin
VVNRTRLVVVLALLAGALAHAQQTPTLVAGVRAAIAKQDFAAGERLIEAHRAAGGDVPQMLAAISWLGRGALAAGQLDKAEAYSQRAYDLSLVELKRRRVDDDPNLATAVGASIEVLAQASAKRGARSEAVAFLGQQLAAYGSTSLNKRIQKNINLLSLEGVEAPRLDSAEYLGTKPPALSALKGKVVVLFFWAHWCGDCKTQGPVLATLLERYASRGLTLIAPTQRYGYAARGATAAPDEEKRYIDQVRQASYGWLGNLPVPLDVSNLERYGVSTTPTLVIVDREGKVRLYNPGRMTEEALEPIIRRLLGA